MKEKPHVPAKNDLRQMLNFTVRTYQIPSDTDIQELERKLAVRERELVKKDKRCQELKKEIKRRRAKQNRKVKTLQANQRKLKHELAVHGPSLKLGERISKLVDQYHEFQVEEF